MTTSLRGDGPSSYEWGVQVCLFTADIPWHPDVYLKKCGWCRSSDLIIKQMENAVKILYEGKEFRNFQKTKKPEMDILLIQGVAADVEAALERLAPEIEQEGGEVTVDVKGPAIFEISTDGISDRLKKKILDALTPRA